MKNFLKYLMIFLKIFLKNNKKIDLFFDYFKKLLLYYNIINIKNKEYEITKFNKRKNRNFKLKF